MVFFLKILTCRVFIEDWLRWLQKTKQEVSNRKRKVAIDKFLWTSSCVSCWKQMTAFLYVNVLMTHLDQSQNIYKHVLGIITDILWRNMLKYVAD